MTIGIFGAGVNSVRLLDAMNPQSDAVKRVAAMPPFNIRVNTDIPEEQQVEPVSKSRPKEAAGLLMTSFEEEEMDGLLFVVDFTGDSVQRPYCKECATAFVETFRNRFPDKVLHVLPLLPDPRDGAYPDEVVEGTTTLQREADGVILYDGGVWDKATRNEKLAVRINELYAYGARDNNSLRDLSWVAANGGMAIGYENVELSYERKLLRKHPVLDDDVVSTLRRAAYGQLTAPVDVSNASRGLVVVRTPPKTIDVEELDAAVDTFIKETTVDTFRVGIQEDAECDSFHTLVALSGSSVGYEAAAVAKQIREMVEAAAEQ